MAFGIWLAEGGEDARGKDSACVIGRGSGGGGGACAGKIGGDRC